VVQSSSDLPIPRCCSAESAPEGTEIGTATHLVLQHLDFSESIEPQIARLVEKKLLTIEQGKLVDREAIAWFLQSDLGRLLQHSNCTVRRELPIYFALEEAGTTGLDQTMVRGRLDLLAMTEKELILLDYKTDRVRGESLRRRAEEYTGQLRMYRQAIEKITGREVTNMVLVFLAARELVEVS
jgi:ATP-dependent helicase/nuclease subunit A